MKKGIITFQNANNYGAVFQSFALQTFMESLDSGGSTEVINYDSEGMGLKKIQETVFAEFINKELNLTKPFNTPKELCGSDYDLIITGSDQVWNPKLTKSDGAYFLDFAGEKCIKASYAASLGIKSEALLEYKPYFKEKLRNFKGISIREEANREFMESLDIGQTEIHIDPTLLIEGSEYVKKLNLETDAGMGDYILLFTYSSAPKLMDVANMISIKYGLPIISVALGFTEHYLVKGAVGLHSTDPYTWLQLIAGAALTVTESYHGMMLSMAFRRPFLIYTPVKDNVVRITSALDKFGLRNRSLKNFDIKSEEVFNIDYGYADEVLSKERFKASEYLKRLMSL